MKSWSKANLRLLLLCFLQLLWMIFYFVHLWQWFFFNEIYLYLFFNLPISESWSLNVSQTFFYLLPKSLPEQNCFASSLIKERSSSNVNPINFDLIFKNMVDSYFCLLSNWTAEMLIDNFTTFTALPIYFFF